MAGFLLGQSKLLSCSRPPSQALFGPRIPPSGEPVGFTPPTSLTTLDQAWGGVQKLMPTSLLSPHPPCSAAPETMIVKCWQMRPRVWAGWGQLRPKRDPRKDCGSREVQGGSLTRQGSRGIGLAGRLLVAKTSPNPPWAGPLGAMGLGVGMVSACRLHLAFLETFFLR